MTRTQIILEAWQHSYLTDLARKSGLSFSGLIRAWIDEEVGAAKGMGRRDPLYGIVGAIDDPASDVSGKVDAYLYGGKKRTRP